MALKAVQAELLYSLDAYLAAVEGAGYQIGLYKNDWTPADTDTIAAVTPADFSGYSGLVTVTGWTAATWVSPRASSTADPVLWSADGGSANVIYGYYVVDGSGALAWAERRTGGGVSVGEAGQTYTVTPKYTRRSEF